MHRTAVSLSGLVLLSAALAAQSYPPPFPRDGATKLMENERVVVWDVTWQKGHPTPMHRHIYDLTGAFLEPGTRSITPLDKPVISNTTKRFDVTYTPKGTTHIEEGTSDHPTRAILIELKEDAPSAAPAMHSEIPPAFPRPGAKQLMDNPRVAIWDYTWTPGSAVPLHQHVRDAVVIWFENGKLKSMPQTGSPSVVDAAFGTIRYNPRGTVHSEELVEGAARAFIIELK